MVRLTTFLSAMLLPAFIGLSVVSVSNVASAQESAGVVCAKCGKIHGPRNGGTSQSPVLNGGSVSPVSYSAESGRSVSGNGSSNVLGMLNGQRARQGVGALSFDPQLQAVAERRARQMAQTGNKNHPPGSFSPGRYEGVGWSSSFSPSGVSACYTSDSRMRFAGAAMAVGRDGCYFAVVYR